MKSYKNTYRDLHAIIIYISVLREDLCIITMENKKRKSLGGSTELRIMVYQRKSFLL